MATTALLHHRGRHRNGYQGLGRQLEDPSPQSRHTYRNRGRGGREGRDTAPGNPSSQQTKDGLGQAKVDKRREIEDRNPEGEEE